MLKLLKQLLNAIFYFIDSLRKKYSLETYIEVISQYTDKIILKEIESGKLYRGGNCLVKKNNKTEILFTVKMYFIDENGQNYIKEAARTLALSQFTRETEDLLKEEKNYDILKPSIEGAK